MKNERGYFTIYAGGREAHASTTKAALEKAIFLLQRTESTEATLTIDRNLIFNYGVLERTGYDFAFTLEATGELYEYDHNTEAFWNTKTPRFSIDYWIATQHVGMSDEEIIEALKALIAKNNQEAFTDEIIEYALIMHNLFYAAEKGSH